MSKSKSILIIGEDATGKTHVAQCIAKLFSNPVFISVHGSEQPAFFSPEYLEVDCLIIEDVKTEDLDQYFNWETEGIIVQLKGSNRKKYVHPKIIITVNDHPKNTPAWACLHSRFEVIKLTNRFPSELIVKY